MAGFYVHIPFCRKQCYYCDFHFSVSLKHKNDIISAIRKEIVDRKDEFSKVQFNTLYFGGGTPSILSVKELNSLVALIQKNYHIISEAEVTLEANPDDLSQQYLKSLRKETIVNRLSIGVQTFNNKILKFLNRQHNSESALNSIKLAKNEEYENISIDLIYGIPGMDGRIWQQNLEIFKTLEIPHLSAYHLTIEPRTVFAYYMKKGKIKPVDEEDSIHQFNLLMQFANENKYEHYEISNFARSGYQSKHNLAYWNRESYIGIGPSAHSFHQNQRRWNIANNTKYFQSILSNSEDYFQYEKIDKQKAYNEYLMTALRTSRGIDTKYLKEHFGEDYLSVFQSSAKKFLRQRSLVKEGNNYYLNQNGKLIADLVISEMMKVD